MHGLTCGDRAHYTFYEIGNMITVIIMVRQVHDSRRPSLLVLHVIGRIRKGCRSGLLPSSYRTVRKGVRPVSLQGRTHAEDADLL